MDARPVVLYFERQQYNLNKLWLIYFLFGFPLLGIIVYSSFEQMLRDRPFPMMPGADMAFFLINGGVLVILLIIPLFINALVLTIQVYPDTLEIKLGPWLQRTVNLEELSQADIITLDQESLLKEYGQRKPGWKLKSQNTYHVNGKEAVRLKLNNGTQIFIGSQRPEELQQVLRSQAHYLISS